jgi:hypothetical protein
MKQHHGSGKPPHTIQYFYPLHDGFYYYGENKGKNKAEIFLQQPTGQKCFVSYKI